MSRSRSVSARPAALLGPRCRELLRPSASVALHRHSNALVDILPPEADSTISVMSQTERPDVTYQVGAVGAEEWAGKELLPTSVHLHARPAVLAPAQARSPGAGWGARTAACYPWYCMPAPSVPALACRQVGTRGRRHLLLCPYPSCMPLPSAANLSTDARLPLQDIGGMDIQKQEIKEAVELPLVQGDLYEQVCGCGCGGGGGGGRTAGFCLALCACAGCLDSRHLASWSRPAQAVRHPPGPRARL